MGKLTFRRVTTVLKKSLFIACLPIAGGLLFLFGSLLFWPGATEAMVDKGALCFLVGSLCYLAAPMLDYVELTQNHGNLLEPPPLCADAVAVAVSGADPRRMAALYEHLYKSHVLSLQRANCAVYMLGGAFFVGGSTLFFPAMEAIIMHGGWLYITGCVLTLLVSSVARARPHTRGPRTAVPPRTAPPAPAHPPPSPNRAPSSRWPPRLRCARRRCRSASTARRRATRCPSGRTRPRR